MGEMTYYVNPNPGSRPSVPFLLDVQAGLLSTLGTRVVVPLYLKRPNASLSLGILTPEVEIQGKLYIAMVPELSSISMRRLGEPAGQLKAFRTELASALKMLISGF